ncbi:hypothetical protein BKA70DRAFT_1555472 [Coprinopsis sp. MPI-PUGE-AT-0042]|nr:hypothetical protein BKA70DRAFT_1555472 [Coprinopsis sp. MPI-PUGE-AT-0042]
MSKVDAEDESSYEIQEPEESSGLLLSSFQSLFNLIRPYAPQIVPVLVCVFLIPLILSLSGFAGYAVWSSLSKGWEIPLYLQYGEGVSPYADILVQDLHVKQRYDVSLHLKVPALESNLELGNFMTSLTFTTMSNVTLGTVRRPAIAVPTKSWWSLRKPSVIEISVPLLSNFIPGVSRILAHVEIGRADSWRSIGDGKGRELSVLSASLRGLAVPRGVRGLAIRFPLISSLLAAFTFFSILAITLGTCVLPIMLPKASPEEEEQRPKRRVGTNSIAFPSSDKVRKKRKSHARRSASDTSTFKQEESFSAFPPAEETFPERLRQRKISVKREAQDDL